MDVAIIVLLCVYIVFFIMGILANPPAEEWMPAVFRQGKLKYLGPVVWIMPVIFAPVLFTVAAVWNSFQQAQNVVKWCASRIFSQPTPKPDVEASCNFEDSILSASDMPPLYEDVEFSLKSAHSASSSVY